VCRIAALFRLYFANKGNSANHSAQFKILLMNERNESEMEKIA
jgi:hypothetical protein